MNHYKLPEQVSINFETFCLDESKLTEQDCVNEAHHELEIMETYEAEGFARDMYGEDHGRYRKQLTSYLTRQRKRGIMPNHDYGYLDDPSKKL